jgi:hypothetical protein
VFAARYKTPTCPARAPVSSVLGMRPNSFLLDSS